MDDKIRILFLAANPADITRLRLDEEAREIDKKIRSADYRDNFELIPQLAVRPSDLQEALMRRKPHIVHFSGHGNRTEGILLQDDQGNATPLRKEVLGNLFKILRDNIRVVVLNACYSKLQSRSITETIDYTVVMKKPVYDESAIAFAGAFYRALAFGRTVKEAFDLGVNEIMLLGAPGPKTPELVIRGGVNVQGDAISPAQSGGSSESGASSERVDSSGGRTTSATGSGNVAIGGNAEGSTIVTGGVNSPSDRN